MCGIVAAVGYHPVMPELLQGLTRLEYRGYDSAGVAVLEGSQLRRHRVSGKLQALHTLCEAAPLQGGVGIAHTRWATHGAPVIANAHPHMAARVAVVHNGIIENFRDLRTMLTAAGTCFTSETDTEVIPHLLAAYMAEGASMQEAMQRVCCMLEGSFALAVLAESDPEAVWLATHGSPLVLGYGPQHRQPAALERVANYAASDAYALLPLTREVVDMHDGDMARISAQEIHMYRFDGTPVQRCIRHIDTEQVTAVRDGYAHFMLKEIYEQPQAIARTATVTREWLKTPPVAVPLAPSLVERLLQAPYVVCVACGTSYYAAMVAQYWFESIAGIRVAVDIASEYRYRNVSLPAGTVVLCISQSGETADTVAALAHSKAAGAYVVGMVNVEHSHMARAAHAVLHTKAGQEIGVASTKAFTTQLVALLELVVSCAMTKGTMTDDQALQLHRMIDAIPAQMETALETMIPAAQSVAHHVVHAGKVLYTGRNVMYPLALEGALKLKELSYLHAEAFPAGELKHGPIALIDSSMPVIALAPKESFVFGKTLSNIQEIAARGGAILPITTEEGLEALSHVAQQAIIMPPCHAWVTPLLYALPVQLIAYYTALQKGTDIDQPRNLAKSVTVE